MDVAQALRTLNPFRGVDPRPEPEIDDDLDAEFAFHLDQLEREFVSNGEEPIDARRRALERFGDVARLKFECRTIALKERLMLQKVNFVLMLVLTLAVIGLGAQAFVSQRENSRALQSIAERLQTAPASTMGESAPGVAYVEGVVERPGVYQLPRGDRLTLRRLLASAGGVKGAVVATITHDPQQGDASKPQVVNVDPWSSEGDDPIIKKNDLVAVAWVSTDPPAGSAIKSSLEGAGGAWRQVDSNGNFVDGGLAFELIESADPRNLKGWPFAELREGQASTGYSLHFSSLNQIPNLHIEGAGSNTEGRWVIAKDQLILNFGGRLPDVTDPVSFKRSSDGGHETAKPAPKLSVQPQRRQIEIRSNVADRVVVDLPSGETVTLADLYANELPRPGTIAVTHVHRLRGGRHRGSAGVVVGPNGPISTEGAEQAKDALRDGDIVSICVIPFEMKGDDLAQRLNQAIQNADRYAIVTGEVHLPGPHLLNPAGEKSLLHKVIADAQPNVVEGDSPTWIYRLPAADPDAGWQAIPGSDVFALVPKEIEVDPGDEIRLSFEPLHDESVVQTGRGGAGGDAGGTSGTSGAGGEGGAGGGAGQPGQPGGAGRAAVPTDRVKLSPFDEIRWANEWEPYGRLSGTWYRIKSINGVSADELVAHCRSHHPGKERKRFGEDLPQVLQEMGHALQGTTVDLEVAPAAGGDVVPIRDAQMNGRNRDRIRDINNQYDEHPRFPPAPVSLGPKEINEDIATLRDALEKRFSYLRLTGIDHLDVLKKLQERLLSIEPTREAIAIEIQKAVCRFGDAHSGVENFTDNLPGGFLPFIVEDSADFGLVAIQPDRSDFLDPAYPTIASIDGVAIERWIDVAKRIVPDASPQSVRRRALRALAHIDYLRGELGLDSVGRSALVDLRAPDGSSRVGAVPISLSRPAPAASRISSDTKTIATDKGNIGYLRLRQMNGEVAATIVPAMNEFKDTLGLIVDVRGNGGGTREALQRFFPYVIHRKGVESVVANIAAHPLNGRFPADHLAARDLYAMDDAHWTDAQRDVIRTFLQSFRSTPDLPSDFSPFHYFLLSATDNPEAYDYDKPVVVLMDEGCFSATDIFLGALSGWPNVTLMGTSSSGGSGRAVATTLPNSGLSVRLSSMISYRSNGQMYDLKGIEPDIDIAVVASDLVGRTDTQLDAAIAHVLKF